MKKRRERKKALPEMNPAELAKEIERLTGESLERTMERIERERRPMRFLGSSTFYGTREEFDKYSELGIRF